MTLTELADAVERQEPARDRKGRFIRRMGSQPDNWLIWSRKWRLWHRRDSEGRAAGYTDSIAEAGLFDRAKAAAYHDCITNEAWHLSDKQHLVSGALEKAEREVLSLRAMVVQ